MLYEAARSSLQLAQNGICPTDTQERLAESDETAIAGCTPRNLQDAARKAAGMRSMGFCVFARMCLIKELKKGLQLWLQKTKRPRS